MPIPIVAGAVLAPVVVPGAVAGTGLITTQATQYSRNKNARIAGMLVGLAVFGFGVYLFWKLTKAVGGKTEFDPEPDPDISGQNNPIQKPVIPPITPVPAVDPDPVMRVSDINLLSGACQTLQYNILQDLEMITPGKNWGFLPKYVEPEPERYQNCAKRIRTYYDNTPMSLPGKFGCDATWDDIVVYVGYIANNTSAKVDPKISHSAKKVWAYLKREQRDIETPDRGKQELVATKAVDMYNKSQIVRRAKCVMENKGSMGLPIANMYCVKKYPVVGKE